MLMTFIAKDNVLFYSGKNFDYGDIKYNICK